MNTTKEGRQLVTELLLEDGTTIAAGDPVRIDGEHAVFTFQHLAINPSGYRAVSCFGGREGARKWRAVFPEKLRVQRGKKLVKLAEFATPRPVAPAPAAPDAVKPKAPKAPKGARRPQNGATEGLLAPAIHAAKVAAGTEIHHGDHTATIDADGFIVTHDGRRFSSPSTAASHLLGGASRNGWVWWVLPNGDKLDALR